MKKFLLWLAWLTLLSVPFLGFSRADSNILDYIKHMEDAGKSTADFWYLDTDNLNIKYVSNNYIEVTSPIVKNWTKDITSYIFYASTSKVYWDSMTYRCYDDITEYITTNWNKFTLELDTKSLNKSNVYYLYAIPLELSLTWYYHWECSASDVDDLMTPSISTYWDVSFVNWKDPCFRIDEWVYWEWNDCKKDGSSSSSDSSSSSSDWNSSSPYTITTNDTHWCNGKKITVGWNSFDDVKIEVLLWYESEQTFKQIWTVNSSDLSFTFNQVFDWDHIVKLKPSDWTTPVDYTIHCLEAASPEVKPVDPVKPVVVWPKENIMIIIIWTIILYVVYRIATRKRS